MLALVIAELLPTAVHDGPVQAAAGTAAGATAMLALSAALGV
jgi:hypothetical protein